MTHAHVFFPWLLCAGWEVSAVTDMSYMTLVNGADISSTGYYSVDDDAKAFNANLNKWDTSSVTDMAGAFYQAKKFNSAIEAWDVSKVKTMAGMFYNANDFNSAIGAWDVSKVKTMACMFSYADVFNSAIEAWTCRKCFSVQMSSMILRSWFGTCRA